MHFTEPTYRSPYWPTWPLLEITQGCTHNTCKFCTMYKGVRFGVSPMEQIEEDLAELAETVPHAETLQLLSGNPLALPFDRLVPILEKVHEYLPDMKHIFASTRVTDITRKTVEQMRALKDLGISQISFGVESGDNWTLERISKGYQADDVLEQCAKLDEVGIRYWLTFLNGVAGREHSRNHAINSAKLFSQLNPLVVGTGGLTLFEDTPLRAEAEAGTFDPLSEREMLEELLLFVENLTCDCSFITHHTIGGKNQSGPDFLGRKQQIIDSLKGQIEHGDLDRMAAIRSKKEWL